VRVRSVNTGPAVTSSTLCPVTLSQSSTDSPPDGSIPRRLAAKSVTVATSTLWETEESQVTGNRTGNSPNRSGNPSSRIPLIRGTLSRASSSTSSVSRHPQS